jgi:hypothetical protein
MRIDDLITKWRNRPGGAEQANFSPFIFDLVAALDLPTPEVAEAGVLGEYQFEGPVPGGSNTKIGGHGRIDLYKRGCFVMEAKQSQLRTGEGALPELFEGMVQAPITPAGASYDQLMNRAHAQARNYALNLPADHPSVPFLVVCDIGRVFDLYFDFAGNGRGYGFYPDKQRYRITLDHLRDPAIQETFRHLWINPRALDPRIKSAEVTQQVSRRLAEVSKALEASNRYRARELAAIGKESEEIEETALFLMRIIFCMFAEDIGLLPPDSFSTFLEEACDNDDWFERGLSDLWAAMSRPAAQDRFSAAIRGRVRYFNGGLFEGTRTFALTRSDRGELLAAARHQWRNVEPAIFGTLLEQALTPSERARLGAHYTPRAYVERLVDATIMDVLNAEWDEASGEIDRLLTSAHVVDRRAAALLRAQAFHERLATVTVLDPACGTGNFLYVAMEAIERLEARVIETIQQLGGTAEPRVGPHQFFGLELNPRAAKIAELVLWIGWLRFRIQNNPDAIPEPVLARGANINFGRHGGYDAVLRRTATGEPDLESALPPEWPEAEFIVGNPPFIGKGAAMRDTLGDDYMRALWRVNPRVPPSADFVMQWWDRAAHILTRPGSKLRRFGFVTTNSITQEFSRRVIAHYLSRSPSGDEREPLSLVFAIPDHPWIKSSPDAAAVRVAMTVAERGVQDGRFAKVVRERSLGGDSADMDLDIVQAAINANLSIGVDVSRAEQLKANAGLASNGMLLAGRGFVLSRSEAEHLIRRDGENARAVVRPYRGGAELVRRGEDRFVIDLFGVTEADARKAYPEIYQHLLMTVQPVRAANNRASYRDRWWVFAEPRREIRPALATVSRFIATTETTKHRIFQFVPTDIVPDHMIVAIASDDASHLGVLCSRTHLEWTYANCGLLGVATFEQGHRYTKSRIFDNFPFPNPTPEQRAAIAELAEELDVTRKAALAQVPRLTMTELYNLREALRAGTLDAAGQARAMEARAGIVDRLHEQIDRAVADAYGWPANLPPSEIVARLVALNAERAAEERAGHIRWLRPDYQAGRFG